MADPGSTIPSDDLEGATGGPTGAEMARAWFEQSPFARQLGLELIELQPDRAEVRLPYTPSIATAGDVVHGGAISSLIDTAAALAAWSSHDPAQGSRWGTVSMTVNFEAAATGEDLLARADITRRGKGLCFVAIGVEAAGGRTVAHALVTYRLG